MIWFLAKPVILCMYHPPVLSVEGCEEETLNSTIQLFSHREAEAYPIKNGITNVTFFRLPINLPTCMLQSLFEHQGPASEMMISLAHSYFASAANRYPGWLGYLSPIYFTTLNLKSTPSLLPIWNLKLCPHLMIAVLRDEFPHSQVCQLSDQVIALSIVHWEHPRLCSVGMGCWFQEVCWKKFVAYLVETLTVSWSRPAFFWMSVTSVHLTITFIVEMRNENDGGLQNY